MRECSYGREPVDLKKLLILFFRKIWLIILSMGLGALLCGGGYYLCKVVLGPGASYEAVTDFYMDYALQPTGEEYTYFNQTTWTQLMGDDVFTDKVVQNLCKAYGVNQEDGSLVDAYFLEGDTSGASDMILTCGFSGRQLVNGEAKGQLKDMLYATMLSDTRIVTTTVTTPSAEATLAINDALVSSMQQFGKEQKEIAGVRILTQPTEASLVIADVRTVRACVLGALVFAFVTLLVLWCKYVADTSVDLPIEAERRYSLPMLGTLDSTELYAFTRALVGEVGTKVIFVSDTPLPDEAYFAQLEEKAGICTEDAFFLGKGAQQESFEKAREAFGQKKDEKLLVLIQAGAQNGAGIEKLLSDVRKLGKEPVAGILWDEDKTLLKTYYMGMKKKSR